MGKIGGSSVTFDHIITQSDTSDWNAPAGEDLSVTLGDAAGANVFEWLDSAGVQVAFVDSDGNATFTTVAASGGLHLNDDSSLTFGNIVAAPNARILWETADANANALLMTLPTGGATDVPVFIIGDDTALNVDLGFWNGITDPSFAILNDAATIGSRLYNNGTYLVCKPTNANGGFAVEDDNSTSRGILLHNNVNFVIQSDVGGINFSTAVSGGLVYLQSASTIGTSAEVVDFRAGAHTGQTASVEQNDVSFDLSATRTWAAGAIGTQRDFEILARTYAFAGASIVDDSVTFYIDRAPQAGANATLTRSYAVWIDAGAVRFDDQVQWGDGVAVTAGNYSIGRDADGTNQLHFNTPTGAGYELSINDVARITMAGDARLSHNVPALIAGQEGFTQTITTSGVAAGSLVGHGLSLAAGYTGGSFTVGLYADNTVAGTNTSYSNGNPYGYRPDGNRGDTGYARATTVGHNIGGLYLAGGGNANYGTWNAATVAKAAAVNIGTASFARNTGGGGAISIGGFFGMESTSSAPTVGTDNSALISDNNDQNAAIYIGRDNGVGVFIIDDGGDVEIAPTVRTSGSPTSFTITQPAHTGLTASTENTSLNFNLSATKQFATGALALQREIRIQAPTYGFVGASTITSSSTVNIDSGPVVGTNATFTVSSALSLGHSWSSAAESAYYLALNVPGISNGMGVATERAGIVITSPTTISLGNQTATLTTLASISLGAITYSSTTLVRTVTNPATFYIAGPPASGGNVTFSNGPYSIFVDSGNSRFDGSIVIPSTASYSAAAGTEIMLDVSPTIAQGGTAGFTAIRVDTTISSSGTGQSFYLTMGNGGNASFEFLTNGSFSINGQGTDYVSRADNASTTDATVTTISTISTNNDSAIGVTASISAIRDTGAQAAYYVLHALFKNDGGVLSIVGAVTSSAVIEDDAAWDATIVVSGTDILVQVTGVAATNISWGCGLKYIAREV